MAFWGNDAGIILDANGVVDCEACPCGDCYCLGLTEASVLPVAINNLGSITALLCADCTGFTAIGDAVHSGTPGSCQWYSPQIPGCALAGANIVFFDASPTECSIIASIATDNGICGCILPTYEGTFLKTDPGPWTLNYLSEITGNCDLSGTTLTIGPPS